MVESFRDAGDGALRMRINYSPVRFSPAQLPRSNHGSDHGPMATPTDCSIPRNGDIDESSTINGEAEASLAHQTHTTPRSILEQWYDVTNRREMTLVTVGRSDLVLENQL